LGTRVLTTAGRVGFKGAFPLNPVDRLGRTIDPAVLTAAEEIGRRAVEHAEKILVDPAVATDLLEESAAAVSRALRTKQQQNGIPVRNVHAYLFRAFIRRVNRAARRNLPLADSPPRHSNGGSVIAADLESKILLDEFLTRCDPVTRDMLYRRIQGFSWKEIGRAYGISAHAAESRFSQALQRVRKRLGLRNRNESGDAAPVRRV